MSFRSGDKVKNERGEIGTIKGSSFNSVDQEWEYIVTWGDDGTEEAYPMWKADSYWSKQETYPNDNDFTDSIRYALQPLYCDRVSITKRMVKAFSFDDFRGFPEEKACNHEWAWYNGFSEQYEFCKKCDIKRR